MPRPTRLPADDVARRLAALPPWTLENGKLRRTYVFADFRGAFAFMTAAAGEADALDHHPEWCNVYNRVVVDLVTHDAQGITELDFELAARMERLAGPAR